ncbi:general secretion pathway protein [bacterium]|nr:general secretion pathway protein [bacterium]
MADGSDSAPDTVTSGTDTVTSSTDTKGDDSAAAEATEKSEAAAVPDSGSSEESADTEITTPKSEADPGNADVDSPSTETIKDAPATQAFRAPTPPALPATMPATSRNLGKSGELRFNFSGVTWPAVLEWFADEADLALQLDQIPIGSWTFADPTRKYSVSEALDVINLALLKRGYCLVRRGRMLQVIDLEQENADKLISELAELVRPEQLEERGKSDIVSCVFPLGSMTADSAKEELALMIGPWGRLIVLDSARQVKVTEAADKLIAIRDLLKQASTADTDVVEIILEHRAADEILELARPLLGLEPGENSTEDIRISVGLFGDRLYAAGLPGKTGLLEKLVEKADQPLASADSEDGMEVSKPVFQTHSVRSADSATVFDVLQTLLAGTPDARIAIDPKTNAIVAWARPETQEVIVRSIIEMEGSGQDFKVIDLQRLDPAQALLTINKFFGITEEGGEGPIVDGDPTTGKLWIRGTTDQITLVEKLLTELEGNDSLGALSEKVRILPYTGRAAEEALGQVEALWPVTGRANKIRTISPSRTRSGYTPRSDMPRTRERSDTIIEAPDARFVPKPTSDAGQHRFVTEPLSPQIAAPLTTAVQGGSTPEVASPSDAKAVPQTTIKVGGADIVVQFTPAGMIIASDDTAALDAFQSLMDSVASPSALASDLPTIIWLKYIKADVAAELISSVLGGAESSISSAVDSVAGGLGGGMLGLLGGLGGLGGGGDTSATKSVLTSTGSVNIVPDARLNALIVQANAIDLQMIQLILEKVDIAESPEDIEIVAKPALIPVIYQEAEDVANIVKSLLGDRIAGAQSSGGRGGGGGQPSPQDFIAALRGGGRGGRGGGGDSAASERSKISVAVDAKSNSLVVIATPQDFSEIEDLVQQLDQSSMVTEETIMTYSTNGSVNPDVMKLALESILGTQASSTSDGSSSGGSSSSSASRPSGATSSSASEIQQRIEAFRARFGSGGFGSRGGSGFGGRTGGGGAPGGGGGRPTGGGGAGGRGGGGR